MMRFQRNDLVRLTFKSALILFAGLLLAPVPSQGKGAEAPAEKISLKVTLDKAAYKPGEAVLATVELTNNTRSEVQAGRLNAGHVIFVFGRQTDPERMERQAVASEKEPLDATFTLEPGKTEKRKFILTRLTEFTGGMVLQVQYLPGGTIAEKINPKIYSNTLPYKVDGARLFVRDPEGFIAKGDALRVARGAVKGEVEEAQAIFVRDEMGFYKWYVNLKPKGAAGLVGWFVDPYTGEPWHQAKPFDPALARDPRFARPANMPKTPLPARVPMNGK